MAIEQIGQSKSTISTNFAVNHLNGQLTDMQLTLMDDKQLKIIGFTETGAVYEYYIASVGSGIPFNGHYSGEEYKGIHRAVLLLEKRKKERIEKSIERKIEDKGAIESLILEPEEITEIDNYLPDEIPF